MLITLASDRSVLQGDVTRAADAVTLFNVLHEVVSDVIGAQVRELRRRKGYTAAQLAERCAEVGAPRLSRAAISSIETGRREKSTGRRTRYVTADEVVLLAYALDVSPVDLLAPPPDSLPPESPYPVAPAVAAEARDVRLWMLGIFGPYGLRELVDASEEDRAKMRQGLGQIEGTGIPPADMTAMMQGLIKMMTDAMQAAQNMSPEQIAAMRAGGRAERRPEDKPAEPGDA